MLWQLPVLFACENNLYAMGTAIARAQGRTDLALRASSYGMPAWSVDGMDVEEVAAAARHATDQIRDWHGPVFLELRTYRFRAHSMYDPERYRDKAEVTAWRERDPIDLEARRLRDDGVLDEAGLDAMRKEIQAEVDAAVAVAEAAPLEPLEDLTRFVYSEEVRA